MVRRFVNCVDASRDAGRDVEACVDASGEKVLPFFLVEALPPIIIINKSSDHVIVRVVSLCTICDSISQTPVFAGKRSGRKCFFRFEIKSS